VVLGGRERIVAQLTHSEYDVLERAIIDGRRMVIYRRGTEYVVIPQALRVRDGREVIEATHPTTGDTITFDLADVDSLHVIK
jgi:hypothetical protein